MRGDGDGEGGDYAVSGELGIRDYELGIGEEEGKHDGLLHLSPAMRRWQEKLAAGYTIEPGLRPARHGGMEWGPSLYNADGAFVQTVRRDTFRRLVALGIARPPEGETRG